MCHFWSFHCTDFREELWIDSYWFQATCASYSTQPVLGYWMQLEQKPTFWWQVAAINNRTSILAIVTRTIGGQLMRANLLMNVMGQNQNRSVASYAFHYLVILSFDIVKMLFKEALWCRSATSEGIQSKLKMRFDYKTILEVFRFSC